MIPLEVAIPIATALLSAILWLAKVTLASQRETLATAERLHNEVVDLTREALTAIANNTAALENIRDAQK